MIMLLTEVYEVFISIVACKTIGEVWTYICARDEDVEPEDDDRVVEQRLCAPGQVRPLLRSRVECQVSHAPEDEPIAPDIEG